MVTVLGALPGLDGPEPVGPYFNGTFPTTAPGDPSGWAVENAFPALTFNDPMMLSEIPGSNDLLVVGKTGLIWRFPNNPAATMAQRVQALDWTTHTQVAEDQGFYSLSFHPNFGQPGQPGENLVFVCYSRAVFDGETCEGKAALVLRGRSATVSGLTFAGMHVREFNGAGIRIEKGNLTVVQSWFRDSDQGILSARDASGTIVIDKSTFTRLGTCDGAGGCAHSIYIGDYGALRVTRSRFEEGRGGHYVKSRTPTVQLASNSFDDSAGQGTNYMIDLPAGSRGQITNNWFVQGVNKENYGALIAVAAEGRKNSSAGLTIAANDARLAPGARKTLFVADWSGDTLGLGENTLGAQIERYERIR